MLAGSIDYGSRTPVDRVPAWATLEVMTGGFATGALLAGGPLQDHEQRILSQLPSVEQGRERSTLNGYFLTESGLAQLQEFLRNRCYGVNVPEEGALLAVAWLLENGFADEARSLIDELAPFFAMLRFYPVPIEQPRQFSSQVHLQTVQRTIADLERIQPNQRVLAQKEAVEVWAPLYDRLIALILETFDGDIACRKFESGWSQRVLAYLDDFANARKQHTLCGKPERANGHFAQLRGFLAKAARQPDAMTASDVAQVAFIVGRYVEKRGLPDSVRCANARQRQRNEVRLPLFHDLAKVVLSRLGKHSKDEGLDDVSELKSPVESDESRRFGLPAGSTVPESIARKVERCLNQTVSELVAQGLITSGEMLAQVLPQWTSGIRAAAIADSSLRHLYTSIYWAFRRRRSLLLLNLEKQVQIEELPWVAVIERFRGQGLSDRDAARRALEEIATLTLTSFPHAILPNKLLTELRALAKTAELNLPLVDEVAADIFMGQFSAKFVESAKWAADLLDGSLYATYYGIDFERIREMPTPAIQDSKMERRWNRHSKASNHFAELCASRAKVPLGTWDPATNGTIIEQQQILTTQNLAVLFAALNLNESLHSRLGEMAWECFRWICDRQQMKMSRFHDQLIMVKNTAYAWRQMIFYLSLLSKADVAEFLKSATSHLNAQSPGFATKFRPALQGLILSAEGLPNEGIAATDADARRFLGWSQKIHWLLDQYYFE